MLTINLNVFHVIAVLIRLVILIVVGGVELFLLSLSIQFQHPDSKKHSMVGGESTALCAAFPIDSDSSGDLMKIFTLIRAWYNLYYSGAPDYKIFQCDHLNRDHPRVSIACQRLHGHFGAHRYMPKQEK